jgi:hypothetical protein
VCGCASAFFSFFKLIKYFSDDEDFDKLSADLLVANQKICQLEKELRSFKGAV